MCVGYFIYPGQAMRTLSKDMFYSQSYQLGLLHVNLSGYPGSGKFTAQYKGGKNRSWKKSPVFALQSNSLKSCKDSSYWQEPASSLCYHLFHVVRWIVPDGGKEKATSQHKAAEYFKMINGINWWMSAAAPSPINAEDTESPNVGNKRLIYLRGVVATQL